ncbi:MAG TPA: nuclear transport factor 2 family protein [Phenylobacterium sp.]|jgi:hypothetical protein|uniref:nuclear transport factor 2 family protein n=1 Tax=Phenylobacterium sp. TaxID=1871053 RepID=UPI002C6E72DB|nr:nuclear transport factor 2 family protein [Phenylobacterium sp.]HXA40546.1 nuclear transport factor 2 family protein [Phenylobacterium sp.]
MSSDSARLGPIAGSADPGFDPNGIALLLLRFSEAVDSRRPQEIAEQFTAGGVFKPAAAALQGPAAVEAFYADRLRDPRRTTRHLWSNLYVAPAADGRAEIRVALSNYAFDPAVSETEVQLRVGNVSGVCARGADGRWRFAEHVYERLYALRLPLSDPQPPQPKP